MGTWHEAVRGVLQIISSFRSVPSICNPNEQGTWLNQLHRSPAARDGVGRMNIRCRVAAFLAVASSLHFGLIVLAAETWTATGALSEPCHNHTATPLLDGRVLVAGGHKDGGVLSRAEIYDPSTGTWTATGSFAQARYAHTATILQNGKVLVVGGETSFAGGSNTASAELYDPTSGLWSATGALAVARHLHTATILPDGKVLVVGGSNGTTDLANAEIYDPETGQWTPTGSLITARYYHTATLLPSGKVLVTGGGGTMLASAELYNPAIGTWTPAASMTQARRGHTATLLPSGKVLCMGSGTLPASRNCELYDPAANSWTPTGQLINGRAGSFTATMLSNGKVLVAGGYDGFQDLAAAEIYNPASGTWGATVPMTAARYIHTATRLKYGKVLVTGGVANGAYVTTSEIFDPGQLEIIITPSPHGTVTGIAASYLPDDTATLTANPDIGYVFARWVGDASGNQNPLSVLIDDHKMIGAIFAADSADDDEDGLSNHAELVIHGTNPNIPDTDGDNFLDGYEVHTGKSPTDDQDKPALVAEARTAIEFTFPAANGKSYRIEASTDLEEWETVESGIPGQGVQVQRFFSTRGMPKRYFRVEEDSP
jgi:WD40 repeat protein